MSSSSSWYSSESESYTVGERVPLQLLNPNQFYKVCPNSKNEDLQPICGDGSPFCFYVSKPSQRNANRDKLMIEVMGGGICWDSNTCKKKQDMLYVDESLDDTLGKSCQELQYGMQTEGAQTNMLCGMQLGSDRGDNDAYVDFTEYNAIIIPYCTQDAHLGSKTMVYYENDDDNYNNNNDDNADDDQNNGNYMQVHHKGGNNLHAVMRWIFRNFPDLRHAAVTGCSAGGTAVPIVQQLLHKHYNHFGNRATQVATLADSPLYLTPKYFLENALGNWDPQPILASIGIPYDKFISSEDYPTLIWDYILRKGNNRNRWGFVSHTNDPVSLTYFQYMSGNGNNDDDGNNYYNVDDDDYKVDDNNMNDDDDRYQDINDKWYSELTSSISYIEKKHKNTKSYWIDSEGHCSFGLYYALQEDDFSSFAAEIFKEDALVTSTMPALRGFLIAAWMGILLLAFLVVHRMRRQSSLEISIVDDDLANELPLAPSASLSLEKPRDVRWAPSVASVTSTLATRKPRSFRKRLRSTLISMDAYPVTAAYTMCITVYFCAMILSQGFAHPINNPSLGPSAVSLSVFGINNPALIIYKNQWYRMLTTNFLVSGVLTLFVAYFYLLRRISKLEGRMVHDFKSPWLFVTISIVIATVINASYCLVPHRRGASTSTIPLLIGLQVFHLTFYWNSFVRPYLSIAVTALETILVVTLFPFNSWVMIAAAIATGWMTAKGARTMDVWLPGPMVNVLKKNGISLELGSIAGDASAAGTATFATALSFPHSLVTSESEYNNFDGNLSNSYETMDDQRSACPDHNRTRRGKFWKRAIACGFLAIFVLFLVPLFLSLVATPEETYLEAYRTGCKSFYTVDMDDLFASSFFSGDDDAGMRALTETSREQSVGVSRWLAGGVEDQNYGCAEFCIPHLVVPIARVALNKKEIPIHRGRCSDNGYATHVLDKTFTTYTYSLDVELYASSSDDDL